MDWEQLSRSLEPIGVECSHLQKELKQIASSMAISLGEAMNAILLAFSGDIELVKFIPKKKKLYERIMIIRPKQCLIRDKRPKIYYCRNKL